MYIDEIKRIENYRNLSGNTIKFENQVNFLIGENNIGKTNILELINIIFSKGKFEEDDFYDITKPIEIELDLKYSDYELGFFESNFDIEDENKIPLKIRQDSVDGRIEYYHNNPMLNSISISAIRKLNVLYYYSQRLPSKEVDFRKNQGSGKVLNFLIEYSLSTNKIKEEDILKKEKLDIILESLNNQIDNLNLLSGDDIRAYINNDSNKIVSRMLELGDKNGRNINNLGEGIQYAFNIVLQILDCIYNAKKTRSSEEFLERLVTDSDGNNLFPIFLILDEPEIHQHPYRQRALIKEINNIIQNNNKEFLNLLKELFEIDGIVGQIFIATHSPNILLNDYGQFIRVYKESANVNIISGCKIELEDKSYKHLLHNYLYLKEAMFSKGVILVEGDTEFGAMPEFASRLDVDLDLYGIGIIKLDEADSVRNCMKIYNEFGIKAIALIDRDKYDNYRDMENVYFTNKMDFEEDVYDEFSLMDYMNYKKEIGKINSMIGIYKRKGIEVDGKTFEEKYTEYIITKETEREIMDEIREDELKHMKSNKDVYNSSLLAKYVTKVPEAFSKVIEKIKEEVI